jgi:hypothetical protein
VQGKLQRPDGLPLDETVTFRPQHSGTWDGHTFAPSAVSVTLGAHGEFVARLVPSSVVGEYEAVCGAFIWRVIVPDDDWAQFAEVSTSC